MNEDIKAVKITSTMCNKDLTNLPMGLEMLYLNTVLVYDEKYEQWSLPQDLVDLNLPSTLNCLYVDECWYNPPYKVPYGCKMIRVSPRAYGVPICQKQKDKECPILNKMKSLYPNSQILIIHDERQLKQYCQNRIAPKNKMF